MTALLSQLSFALQADTTHPKKPKVNIIEACKAAHTYLTEKYQHNNFYVLSAKYVDSDLGMEPYWLVKIVEPHKEQSQVLNLYVGMDLEYSIIPPRSK
jgi:hypothetical protein